MNTKSSQFRSQGPVNTRYTVLPDRNTPRCLNTNGEQMQAATAFKGENTIAELLLYTKASQGRPAMVCTSFGGFVIRCTITVRNAGYCRFILLHGRKRWVISAITLNLD